MLNLRAARAFFSFRRLFFQSFLLAVLVIFQGEAADATRGRSLRDLGRFPAQEGDGGFGFLAQGHGALGFEPDVAAGVVGGVPELPLLGGVLGAALGFGDLWSGLGRTLRFWRLEGSYIVRDCCAYGVCMGGGRCVYLCFRRPVVVPGTRNTRSAAHAGRRGIYSQRSRNSAVKYVQIIDGKAQRRSQVQG
jgi:hypothetical protein